MDESKAVRTFGRPPINPASVYCSPDTDEEYVSDEKDRWTDSTLWHDGVDFKGPLFVRRHVLVRTRPYYPPSSEQRFKDNKICRWRLTISQLNADLPKCLSPSPKGV